MSKLKEILRYMDSIFPYTESFLIKLPLTYLAKEQHAGAINLDSLCGFFILIIFPFTCESFLAFALSTCMSWCHPSLLPSRSSLLADGHYWPILANILVADHPRCYLGDCPVHTLTNNIRLVLIHVLAMLVSFLSFSADDSPMYTCICLRALVLCICANSIG
jgi:hypothetical protein